jgi:hypothetical protein
LRMSGSIGGSLFAAAMMMYIIILVIWFIIAIAVGVWVYRDAESRGMGGAMWLIICLILGIIGLIIYLIVRKPKTVSTSPTTTGTTTT